MTTTEELTTHELRADMADSELGRRLYNRRSKASAFKAGLTEWARIECAHAWLFTASKDELEAIIAQRDEDDLPLSDEQCESCLLQAAELFWSDDLGGAVCHACVVAMEKVNA
jgi:hypothetical protein